MPTPARAHPPAPASPVPERVHPLDRDPLPRDLQFTHVVHPAAEIDVAELLFQLTRSELHRYRNAHAEATLLKRDISPVKTALHERVYDYGLRVRETALRQITHRLRLARAVQHIESTTP